MSKNREVKSFPILMAGPRILIYPYNPVVRESKIIMPNNDIDIRNQNKSKLAESKALDLFDNVLEHPYQGIIVAIGKEASDVGYKIGDIVYGSSTLLLSRDEILINGDIYKAIGYSSIYCVVGNKKLKEESIKSEIL
jgi:hypothetical protein